MLRLRTDTDPVLRRQCEPLKKVGSRERDLFIEMTAMMRRYNGIGLAAPQVGIPQQLVVMEIGEDIVALANPRVSKPQGRRTMKEGCLSLPGLTVRVPRAREITVTGLDTQNNPITLTLKGLAARVVQHEVDHLKGILISDYRHRSVVSFLRGALVGRTERC